MLRIKLIQMLLELTQLGIKLRLPERNISNTLLKAFANITLVLLGSGLGLTKKIFGLRNAL